MNGLQSFDWRLSLAPVLLLSALAAPSTLAAAEGARGGAVRPVRTLQGAPAGALVEVPGAGAKAEVLGLPAGLARELARVRVGEAVTLAGWPVAPGERADVVVTRRDVYSPEAEIWEIGPSGRRRVPRSPLIFLWGKAEDSGSARSEGSGAASSGPGSADSATRVLVSLDPSTGELRGLSLSPSGAHELTPVPAAWKAEAGSGYVVGPRDLFLDAKGKAVEKDWKCGQESLPEPFAWAVPAPAGGQGVTPIFGEAGISTLHTATIAVDTDNQIMANKFGGNTATATNYIASLFAQMNLLYERDVLVRLLVGTTFLRSAPDPYPLDDVSPYSDALNGSKLNEFTGYWAANQGAVNRALALMLSGRGGSGAAGVAWVGALCSKSVGYAYSRVYTSGTSPNFGDTLVTAHELGHNFGSPHTHCYNTIGLANPDNCYSGESFNNQSCFSGATVCPASATYNGVTNVRGSLMSYCHLLGGCSASLVFHPATVDLLDDIILSRTTGGNACIFPFVQPGPTVSSVTPALGPAAGGTPVTIVGTNFAAGATVTFDSSAATAVVVVNSTTITALAPAHATGAVRVTVTNPDTTTGFKDNAFFYSLAPAATGFYTVTPCRVIDTRNPTGPRGGPALQANAARLFTVTGVCGVPAGAKAISVNVTVVAQGGSGSFTFYPGNAFPLGTNNLSFPAGANRAGASILQLSTSGTGTIGVTNFSAVNHHLILDVNGYFQ